MILIEFCLPFIIALAVLLAVYGLLSVLLSAFGFLVASLDVRLTDGEL